MTNFLQHEFPSIGPPCRLQVNLVLSPSKVRTLLLLSVLSATMTASSSACYCQDCFLANSFLFCLLHGKLLSVLSATCQTVSSSLCFLVDCFLFCLLVNRLLPCLPAAYCSRLLPVCLLCYKMTRSAT
jgi:hypothetical protein